MEQGNDPEQSYLLDFIVHRITSIFIYLDTKTNLFQKTVEPELVEYWKSSPEGEENYKEYMRIFDKFRGSSRLP